MSQKVILSVDANDNSTITPAQNISGTQTLTLNAGTTNSVIGLNFGNNNTVIGPLEGHAFEFQYNNVVNMDIVTQDDSVKFYINPTNNNFNKKVKTLVNIEKLQNGTDSTTATPNVWVYAGPVTYTPLFPDSQVRCIVQANTYVNNTGTDDDAVSRWNLFMMDSTYTTALQSAVSESAYGGMSNTDPDAITRMETVCMRQHDCTRDTDGNIYAAFGIYESNDTTAGWAMVTGFYYATYIFEEWIE